MYLERVTEKQKKDANIRRAHHNVHVIIVWVAYKQRRTIRVSASSSSDVKSSIDIAESWFPSGLWRYTQTLTQEEYVPFLQQRYMPFCLPLFYQEGRQLTLFLVTLQKHFEVLRQSCAKNHVLFALDAWYCPGICVSQIVSFSCRPTFEDKHLKCFKCVGQISKRLKNSISVNDVNAGICQKNVTQLHQMLCSALTETCSFSPSIRQLIR